MALNLNRKASIRLASGFAGLLAAALSLAPALHAQTAGQPSRAVRLSYVDGKVQLTQGSQQLADQAAVNTPLFEGTQINTGNDGKAEVQLEDGSVARISPDSSLTLRTLNNGESSMVLDRGLAYFELQTGGQSGGPVGTISVAFADSVVTASGFTILRVDVDNPPGAIAVFSGNAHVERGAGNSLDLHGGESAEFNGADPSNPNVAEAIQPDSWDAWNSDRDQSLNAETSTQSRATGDIAGASPSNPAWSDLNASGNWYNVSGQGYVWSPYEAANAGFDPYGSGAWVSTGGYGSVWASAYPWGYMPYQCGLWNFYDGFGWGWAPGFGGCNPWWGVGFYGGPRFGILPIGYPPIHVPRPGPVRGGRVLTVNRTSFHAATALPARNRNTPVVIDGQTVQALRTARTQPAYSRAGTFTHAAPAQAAQPGARSAYVPGSRSSYASSPSNPGYHAPYAASRPQNYAPAPRNYSPPPRMSAPPPPSGGGGGAHGGGGHR